MGWFLSRKESPLGGGGDGGDGTPKVDGKQAVELIHGGGGWGLGPPCVTVYVKLQ